MLLRAIVIIGVFFVSFTTHAQRRVGGDHPDAIILNKAKLVSQTDKIEVYRDDMDIEDGFTAAVDQIFTAIESQLNRKFDVTTLGKKIKIVVSNNVRVSHVWRGYQHMSDPQAIIFLNARAYNGFKTKSNATLVHEMTHLFTWRYNSHSLREGIADYIARTVMPGTAVGPNEMNASITRVDWAFKYIGSNHPAPPELTTDAEFRKQYYFLSYVFVKALIEKTSITEFLKFYDDTYSDALFENIFKVKRFNLICELKLDTSCKAASTAVSTR
jgi:hypothetical protein